jgi:hypothetical protein
MIGVLVQVGETRGPFNERMRWRSIDCTYPSILRLHISCWSCAFFCYKMEFFFHTFILRCFRLSFHFTSSLHIFFPSFFHYGIELKCVFEIRFCNLKVMKESIRAIGYACKERNSTIRINDPLFRLFWIELAIYCQVSVTLHNKTVMRIHSTVLQL